MTLDQDHGERFVISFDGAGYYIRDRRSGRRTTSTWAEARAMLEATRLEIAPNVWVPRHGWIK